MTNCLQRPSINQLSIQLTAGSKTAVPKSRTSHSSFLDFNDRFIGLICTETRLTRSQISGIFPCTPAQEGMLSQFLRSKGRLYFNHIVFKLPRGVDLTRLRESWNVVTGFHDMLRAGFVEVDDARHSFATIIHRQDAVNLPWSTVNSMGDIATLISGQKELNTSRVFEKLHLPPWGVTVFKNGSEDHLLFSAHHALYDAKSLSLVLNDVFCEYSGGDISPRPHFSEVLDRIMKHTLNPEVSEGDKSFWMKQLQGSSISRFPNLCPLRVKSTSSHICSIETSWSLSKIEKACRKLGMSVNSVGQAAWARVLSAYMGDNAVTIGIGKRIFRSPAGLY